MRKVEEFQETQKLMEEYKNIGDKIPEIDNKIDKINKTTNLTIERLKDEMKLNWDDVEFNLDRESVEKEYEKRINDVKENQEKEIKELNKQKEEAKDDKKYFRTDSNLKTITMEIEEMKKEVRKEEVELKKKDIELQEFYDEETHENPLRWQEIYNEKDELRKNIKQLNDKIEEYSEFINELKAIELTLEEYKKMYEREIAKAELEKANSEQEKKVDSEEKTDKDPEKEDEKKVDPEEKAEKRTEKNIEPTKHKNKDYELDFSDLEDEKENVDLSKLDVKIVIDKQGIKVHLPDKDVQIPLKDYKEKWKEVWNKDKIKDFLKMVPLNEKNLKDVDPMILTGISEIMSNANIPDVAKDELVNKYANAVLGTNKKDEILKGIIQYDRTGLDYLKPSNIISRIINKEQFDNMRNYADIAEEKGFADIKRDEKGWIRQFLSNMRNKVKLLGEGVQDRRALAKLSKNKEYRESVDSRVSTHTSITEKDGDIKFDTYDYKKNGDCRNDFISDIYNKKAAEESNRKHSEQTTEVEENIFEYEEDELQQ